MITIFKFFTGFSLFLTIFFTSQIFGSELPTKGILVCDYSGEIARDDTVIYCHGEKIEFFSTSQKEIIDAGWKLAYKNIEKPISTGCPQCEKWKKPGLGLGMYNSCIELCVPNYNACNQVYIYEKQC